MCHGLPVKPIGDGFFSDDIPEPSSEEKAEKPTLAREHGFSWRLAEITDRHNKMRDSNTTSTDILQKIHRKYDPDHKKSVERLRKSYGE